jgi:hypothetical protein
MSNQWPKIRFDAACPPDKAFLMPPDVTAGIDLMDAATTLLRHGFINWQDYTQICQEVTDRAASAAREGRVGVIKNLKIVTTRRGTQPAMAHPKAK